LTTPAGCYVLRKQPPGTLNNKRSHRVDREYLILKCLGKSTSIPVPQVICLCTDRSVLGTDFFVMHYVEGRNFGSPALHGFSASERAACYQSVVETLAALHLVDWRAIGLQEYGQNGNYYQRQLRSMKEVSARQEAVSPSVPRIANMQTVSAALEAYQPDDEVCVVHGDWKFDNFLVSSCSQRLCGRYANQLYKLAAQATSSYTKLAAPFDALDALGSRRS
jgi:aminoglycoside phosphotransferase (APT) family kinase protein